MHYGKHDIGRPTEDSCVPSTRLLSHPLHPRCLLPAALRVKEAREETRLKIDCSGPMAHRDRGRPSFAGDTRALILASREANNTLSESAMLYQQLFYFIIFDLYRPISMIYLH